jgi:FlaG/FlaF family flagellin (archaellin)
MDNKGVSPVISMVLIIGLTVALFSFSTTQYLDMSESSTEYSTSDVELEELSGQDGVKVRLTQERKESDVYLETPKDRIKLEDAGSVESASHGSGEYSVISVKDGESLLLKGTVIE